MAYQLNLQEPSPGAAIVTVSFKTEAAKQVVLQAYCKRAGCKMGALLNSALNDLLEKIKKEADNG